MRTIFSSEKIAELAQNPCVFSCSERSIHYTYEFKKRTLELYAQGINSDEIWRRSGFDVGMWKKDYCKYTVKDWRRIVRKKGLEGLTKLGGQQSDKGPKTGKFIDEDKVRRLKLQVRYLEAENDFLAKLRARRAESNSGRMRNSRSSENSVMM